MEHPSVELVSMRGQRDAGAGSGLGGLRLRLGTSKSVPTSVSRSMSPSRTSQRANAAPAKERIAPSRRISLRPCRKPCSAALRVARARPAGSRRDRLRQRPRGGRLDQAAGLARRRPSRRPTSCDLGGAGAEEDRPPGGDPDRDPDLAEGVVDPRRHAALLLRHDAERDVGDHRVEQPDADAADEEADQQRRPLGVAARARTSAAGRPRSAPARRSSGSGPGPSPAPSPPAARR